MVCEESKLSQAIANSRGYLGLVVLKGICQDGTEFGAKSALSLAEVFDREVEAPEAIRKPLFSRRPAPLRMIGPGLASPQWDPSQWGSKLYRPSLSQRNANCAAGVGPTVQKA
jgi:hypothetical protein